MIEVINHYKEKVEILNSKISDKLKEEKAEKELEKAESQVK